MRLHNSSLNAGHSTSARFSERQPSIATDAFFGGNELAAKINQANLWLRPSATVINRECSWHEQPEDEVNFPSRDMLLPAAGNGHGDLSELIIGLRAERERTREKLKRRALAVALGAAVAGLLVWSAHRTVGQEDSPAGNHADSETLSSEGDSQADDLATTGLNLVP